MSTIPSSKIDDVCEMLFIWVTRTAFFRSFKTSSFIISFVKFDLQEDVNTVSLLSLRELTGRLPPALTKRKMTLYVKFLCIKTLIIDGLSNTDSVAVLREKIKANGFNYHCKIIFNNRRLTSLEETLKDCGIEHQSVLLAKHFWCQRVSGRVESP